MSRRRKRRGSSALPELALPDKGVPRRLRVEGDVQQAVASALRDLADPRVAAATVTRVQMPDDLQSAKVFVRLAVGATDSEQARKRLMKGLDAATGRVRSHLGRAIQLRYTPSLRFFYDTGLEAAARVDELLAEIRAERPDTPGD